MPEACGTVSPDGGVLCALPPGHEPPEHSWERVDLPDGDPGLPPVPFVFFGQPETYRLAVKWYLDTLGVRVLEDRGGVPGATTREVVAKLLADMRALQAMYARGDL